jgi:transposase
MRMRVHSKLDKRVISLRKILGIGPIDRVSHWWLGLTPVNRSSGGKERLGRITKMGDRYIRCLFVTRMTVRLRQIKLNLDHVDP